MKIKITPILALILFSSSAFAISDWSEKYNPNGYFENDQELADATLDPYFKQKAECASKKDTSKIKTEEVNDGEYQICLYDITTTISYSWDDISNSCKSDVTVDLGELYDCKDEFLELREECESRPNKVSSYWSDWGPVTSQGRCKTYITETTDYYWDNSSKSCKSKITKKYGREDCDYMQGGR